MLRCAQHDSQDSNQVSEQTACHPEPIRCTQGKLREGSRVVRSLRLHGEHPLPSNGRT
jgi:hypothetical protein